MFDTLIDCTELAARLNDRGLRVCDCRADLKDADAARRAYASSHIPGAVYVDLEEDLSGPPVTDRGRHPMPTPVAMIALFSRLGIDPDTQVVAYDATSGAFAARLWWMLHYMGHRSAAVLDGGWNAWIAGGWPTNADVPAPAPARFDGRARDRWLVRAHQLDAAALLMDARDAARYAGENEPIDPKAGHIPGAVNYCWQDNLDEDGRFRPVAALRSLWLDRLGPVPAGDTVSYCGSGVTACHNLLAMARAGLGMGGLYAGSWSDWCSDDDRPVATGYQP